jgi:hypothetical protein
VAKRAEGGLGESDGDSSEGIGVDSAGVTEIEGKSLENRWRVMMGRSECAKRASGGVDGGDFGIERTSEEEMA